MIYVVWDLSHTCNDGHRENRGVTKERGWGKRVKERGVDQIKRQLPEKQAITELKNENMCERIVMV